jgi:hypothetical protein
MPTLPFYGAVVGRQSMVISNRPNTQELGRALANDERQTTNDERPTPSKPKIMAPRDVIPVTRLFSAHKYRLLPA